MNGRVGDGNDQVHGGDLRAEVVEAGELVDLLVDEDIDTGPVARFGHLRVVVAILQRDEGQARLGQYRVPEDKRRVPLGAQQVAARPGDADD